MRKEAAGSKALLHDDTAHGEQVPATALQVSAVDQPQETRSKRGAKGRVQWASDGGVGAAAQNADSTSGAPLRPSSPSSMHGSDGGT